MTYITKLLQYLLLPWWCTSQEDFIFWHLWQWTERHILVIDGMSIRSCSIPLPLEPRHSVFQVLDWSGLMLSCFPPPRRPCPLKAYQKILSQSLIESYAAPDITALSPAAHCTHTKVYFYGPASFFTLPRTGKGEITQHHWKRFDWSVAPPVRIWWICFCRSSQHASPEICGSTLWSFWVMREGGIIFV